MTPGEYNAKVRKILPAQKKDIDNLAKLLLSADLANKQGHGDPISDEFLHRCVMAHIRHVTELAGVAKEYLDNA